MDKTNKKTVIVGATTNPSRYAFMAAEKLVENHHEIVPIGVKSGEVFGEPILNIGNRPLIGDVDTITLYIGPQHQPEHYEYLLSLKPKRVIFNPGTENVEFEKKVEESGAEALEACTLVMLSTGQY
ncbi:MAG: CoA-binding protein [Cyclobacteriaceae bacterium]|nr:CoA-binding protein [Cyclobacteriaceae bacterium]